MPEVYEFNDQYDVRTQLDDVPQDTLFAYLIANVNEDGSINEDTCQQSVMNAPWLPSQIGAHTLNRTDISYFPEGKTPEEVRGAFGHYDRDDLGERGVVYRGDTDSGRAILKGEAGGVAEEWTATYMNTTSKERSDQDVREEPLLEPDKPVAFEARELSGMTARQYLEKLYEQIPSQHTGLKP